jgi:acyl-CoA thioester hydrolase
MPCFCWDIRVYYEDTDAGGIAFYANYLKFFERARTEWLRAAGISQEQLMREESRMFVVRSTAVDYHQPARLDDMLQISVVVEKMGRASVGFYQEARRKGQAGVLCSGRIRVACVELDTLRPAAIPEGVLRKIAAAPSAA